MILKRNDAENDRAGDVAHGKLDSREHDALAGK